VSAPPPKVPPILCPSAQPDWEGAVVIGVMGGSASEPQLSHLNSPLPVTQEILSLAEPVTPTEVFRIAAPCLEAKCQHFVAATCRLAERLSNLLPEITERPPACAIRAQCRWWGQEGLSACRRCPQVVTDNYNPSHLMKKVAHG